MKNKTIHALTWLPFTLSLLLAGGAAQAETTDYISPVGTLFVRWLLQIF